MEQIKAPFTPEQVVKLNEYQKSGEGHPFTCCSPDSISQCERKQKISNGTLIATEHGWICPCGKSTQDWAYAFMAESQIEQSEMGKKHMLEGYWFENEHGIVVTVLSVKDGWCMVKEDHKKIPYVLEEGFVIAIKKESDQAEQNEVK